MNRLFFFLLFFTHSFLFGQTPKEIAYLNKILYNAKTNESSGSNLTFLENIIKNKSIVLIGESSHGVKEFNLYKLELIKFLHEKMGYNIVAFENSMDNTAYTQFSDDTMSSKHILKKAFNIPWQTQENLDIINYVQNEKIKIIGIDPQFFYNKENVFKLQYQKSNLTFQQYSLLNKSDSLSSYVLVQSKTNMNNNNYSNIYYDSIKVFVLKNYRLVYNEKLNNTDNSIQELNRIINNRIRFIQSSCFYNNFNNCIRDSIMAENLSWYFKEQYPNQKMIVIAHNSHVMKNFDPEHNQPCCFMGEVFGNNILPSISYTIGFYMNEGEVMLNSKKKIQIKSKKKKSSLENYLKKSPYADSFIAISSEIENENNKWIFTRISSLYWGLWEEKIVPNKAYDGIFFIKKVTTPNYIN